MSCSCNPYAWNPALSRWMCPDHGTDAKLKRLIEADVTFVGRPQNPDVSLEVVSPKKCSACTGTGVKTDDNGVQEDDVCPRCEGTCVEPEGE